MAWDGHWCFVGNAVGNFFCDHYVVAQFWCFVSDERAVAGGWEDDTGIIDFFSWLAVSRKRAARLYFCGEITYVEIVCSGTAGLHVWIIQTH